MIIFLNPIDGIHSTLLKLIKNKNKYCLLRGNLDNSEIIYVILFMSNLINKKNILKCGVTKYFRLAIWPPFNNW